MELHDGQVKTPKSHKTVIVIDHGENFAQFCGETVELDPSAKLRGNINSTISEPNNMSTVFYKTIWSSALEAVIEYCRIVFDLFDSDDKMISVVSMDESARVISAWYSEDQSVRQIMARLEEMETPPAKNSHFNYQEAVQVAVNLLKLPTEKQLAVQADLASANQSRLGNAGRVIMLSHFRNNAHIHDLAASLVREIKEHNASVSATNLKRKGSRPAIFDVEMCRTEHLPIDHCELLCLHVNPMKELVVGGASSISLAADSCVSSEAKHQADSEGRLFVQVEVCPAGIDLARCLVRMGQVHFNLASTTVLDIPMKEEQTTATSAATASGPHPNKAYNVELLHEASAHDELRLTGQLALIQQHISENIYPQTVGLKWQTPKSTAIDLLHCTQTLRITTADVHGRPSLCLTNFLRGGRYVMLEQPKQTSSVVSMTNRNGSNLSNASQHTHMLACHGGDLYLHVLSTCRSALEDPVSLSEGPGGRVTDYRIKHMAELLRSSRLLPGDENHQEFYSTYGMPNDRSKRHLERATCYWPMTFSETVLCAGDEEFLLQTLLSKEYLDDCEVEKCQSLVRRFVETEQRGESVCKLAGRTLPGRREEQNRIVFSELEFLLRKYMSISDAHASVLQMLLKLRHSELTTTDRRPTGLRLVDAALQSNVDKTEKRHLATDLATGKLANGNDGEAANKRSQIAGNIPHNFPIKLVKSDVSLLDSHLVRLRAIYDSRHPELDGRRHTPDGQVAKLYPNLGQKEREQKPSNRE